MAIKTSERKHIETLGRRWSDALAAASLSIRLNPKLIGLDKIRDPLALAATLKATGCPDHDGFVIPKGAGEPTREMQDVVDAAFALAVEVAQIKFKERANA